MEHNTLFKLGDTVWCMENNKPKERRIIGVKVTYTAGSFNKFGFRSWEKHVVYNTTCLGKERELAEADCFASKEELFRFVWN